LKGGVLNRDKNNIISVGDSVVNQRNASIFTNDTTSHESGTYSLSQRFILSFFHYQTFYKQV
jgi:hypothetical protein